jgi:hypothetical protein
VTAQRKLKHPPRPLFEYQVPDVAAKIRACEASGVDLAQWEQDLLRNWRHFHRPSQKEYRLLWRVCRRCGVGQ